MEQGLEEVVVATDAPSTKLLCTVQARLSSALQIVPLVYPHIMP